MKRHKEIGSARSGALFGVMLVVVGTVLLMQRLDLVPMNLLRHFWPLAWVAFGCVLLTGNRSPFGRALGVTLIASGIGWELQKLGYIRFRIWDLWPVQLIALGVFLLWRALRPPDPGKEEFRGARIADYAVFGGVDTVVTSQEFEGGTLTAVFGGCEVNLQNAKLAGNKAVLHADAIFGGVSLRVPPQWRVTLDGQAIFGGMENKTMVLEGEAPELIVHGFAACGGIEIKY